MLFLGYSLLGTLRKGGGGGVRERENPISV